MNFAMEIENLYKQHKYDFYFVGLFSGMALNMQISYDVSDFVGLY